MKPTHIVNLQLGFDLSEPLSPDNVKGVMFMLGAKTEDDVARLYLDKSYKEIVQTLSAMGVNVLGGNVETVQAQDTEDKQVPTGDTTTSETDKEEVEHDSEDKFLGDDEVPSEPAIVNDDKVNQLVEKLMDFITTDGNIITKLLINKKYEDDIEDLGALATVLGLADDVEIQYRAFKDKELEATFSVMDVQGNQVKKEIK